MSQTHTSPPTQRLDTATPNTPAGTNHKFSFHQQHQHYPSTKFSLAAIMDYNVNATAAAASSSSTTQQDPPPTTTPTAVILARNIQKFFQTKSDQLLHSSNNNNTNNSFSSSSSSSTNNNNNSNDINVPAVLKDIDDILEGRSERDGRLLLRGMVSDLLKEVDLLRFRLDTATAQLATVKEERDVVNNEYRDRLVALLRAVSHITQNCNNNSNGSNNAISESLMKQERWLLQQGTNQNSKSPSASPVVLLTPDDAMALTIQSLTRKIESLNVESTVQLAALAAARDRTEDLESAHEAQTHKIAALEKQFCSINQKRHKHYNTNNNNTVTANAPNTKQTTVLQQQGNKPSDFGNTNNDKNPAMMPSLNQAMAMNNNKSSTSANLAKYKAFLPSKVVQQWSNATQNNNKENVAPFQAKEPSTTTTTAILDKALAVVVSPTTNKPLQPLLSSSSSSNAGSLPNPTASEQTATTAKRVVLVTPPSTKSSLAHSSKSFMNKSAVNTSNSGALSIKERATLAVAHSKNKSTTARRAPSSRLVQLVDHVA